MKRRLCLTVIAVFALAPLGQRAFASIGILAEVELKNGRVIHPAVTLKEGEWSSIEENGVGLKLRARRLGDKQAQVDYQIYVKNGPAMKNFGGSRLVTRWSQPQQVPVKDDKDNRVRRLQLTPTLIIGDHQG
jgi:hypothetical protein